MRKIAFFTTITLCLFIGTTFGQGIKIGIGGGLTKVQSPDEFTNDINNGGLGFGNEWHIGVKGKIDVPLIPLTPIFFINYHSLSGEQNTTMGDFTTSQNIISIGAGGEFSLIPGPLSPYLGLDISLNNFGEFESKSPTGTVTGDSRSRFGLGIGAGAEFTLLPIIDLDASVKYTWLNLIGAEDGEGTIGVLVVNASVLFSAL